MDLNSVRRVSSAGYRLQERSNGARPTITPPPAPRPRYARGDTAPAVQHSDGDDAVKQDQVWKQVVWSERRGVLEWEKNWSFLRNYDQLGRLRSEEPLPSYVPLFSDRVPNTTNQMFGNRLSTELGAKVVRLDNLLLWSGHHKRKMDPEMLSY
ncbi:uncharacterized protein C2orf50 homolog [Mugil cephalus]|uniref:uncharacterized protein C2orf50 homolog n=1 Tax=Mugil cephalus TaxID=48193 RepID=UPI001FB76AF6|nr:uncharacterized protein C2orf50 homolog [Mugil cephalus]